MENWISWIILGAIIGGLAKMISPGKEGGGCLTSIIIGLAGSVVGGFLGKMLLNRTVQGFDFVSLLIALGGSLLVLWVYKKFIQK